MRNKPLGVAVISGVLSKVIMSVEIVNFPKFVESKIDLLAQHYLEGVNSCPLQNILAVMDAVLGGRENQPGPYDAVLGGKQLRKRQFPI